MPMNSHKPKEAALHGTPGSFGTTNNRTADTPLDEAPALPGKDVFATV